MWSGRENCLRTDTPTFNSLPFGKNDNGLSSIDFFLFYRNMRTLIHKR